MTDESSSWLAAYTIGVAHTHPLGPDFRREVLPLPDLDAATVRHAREAIVELSSVDAATRRTALRLLDGVLEHLERRPTTEPAH